MCYISALPSTKQYTFVKKTDVKIGFLRCGGETVSQARYVLQLHQIELPTHNFHFLCSYFQYAPNPNNNKFELEKILRDFTILEIPSILYSTFIFP